MMVNKLENNHSNNQASQPPSILDTIIGSKAQSSLVNFEPSLLVSSALNLLKTRDREILIKRFGLDGFAVETLEAIGKKYNLTRERIRQIEKDSLLFLRQKKLPELEEALQLIFDTISEHGNVISEEMLTSLLLVGKGDSTQQRAVNFLLNLGDQFEFHKETNLNFSSWSIFGFDFERLNQIILEFVGILKKSAKVLTLEELLRQFKNSSYYQQHKDEMNDRTLKSYLAISKQIQTNPFAEVGLEDWSEIKPHDVGDKAYLVLKHNGKPEHYSLITKMINDNNFDNRTAYLETVHNELIKDNRFVLVGRGIYALSEWGYKKGVVADVIREIIKEAGRPLGREEIIAEVLKKRQVKRNTILVGLSNKKYFQKVGKDKYASTESNLSVPIA